MGIECYYEENILVYIHEFLLSFTREIWVVCLGIVDGGRNEEISLESV